MKSDGSGGPWGGRDDGGSGSGGNEGPRQPWGQPRRRRPDRHQAGPPALEALLRKGRERFHGRLPEPAGRPLWLWAATIFVVLWLLLTCIHRIDPQQRGVVSRFGRYVATLEPGVRLTWPAPIDSVRKLNVEDARSLDIGLSGERADNAMITSDHDVVELAYSVLWRIRDPELYAYALAEPKDTITEVARSVMRGEIANAPLDRVLVQTERDEIAESARGRMQEMLDSYGAGVQILEVTIKRADPPKEVSDAFKHVAEAQQEAQHAIADARSYAETASVHAQGEAAQFDAAYAQYKAAPEVTRDRIFFKTMEDVLANTDKIIVDAPGVTLPPLSELRRKPVAQGQDVAPIIVESKR